MDSTTGEVDIFSKESLQLTFELLRKSNPQLALTVRNIAGGEPLLREDADDLFRVDLNSSDVRKVVEELMCFTNPDAVDVNNPSINILARSLMQDWLLLAHQLIAQMPLNNDFNSPNLPLG